MFKDSEADWYADQSDREFENYMENLYQEQLAQEEAIQAYWESCEEAGHLI